MKNKTKHLSFLDGDPDFLLGLCDNAVLRHHRVSVNHFESELPEENREEGCGFYIREPVSGTFTFPREAERLELVGFHRLTILCTETLWIEPTGEISERCDNDFINCKDYIILFITQRGVG